jgi:hypothetical protein
MQDLNIQLNALSALKSFIEQFRESLLSKRQTYQNKMLGLHDEGVSLQVADAYCKDFWDKNNMIISNLIGALRETDYPYILRQIEAIENAIQAAGGGGSVSASPKSKMFEDGVSKLRSKMTEDANNTITKKCANCGKDFETTFVQNIYCPECFIILLNNKNAFQNERER